ncbi:MAG TPA: DegT/DnrJ/EryC1/StrS family aminotransferase [Cyclobacteriaceae bacterium]|nr:DegT/DnrJ/EryC1/StrS family aminotransferase [Cyclobacteriaceae bacterium]
MEIRMVDLHGQYLRIKAEIDHAIQSVVDSTAFIKGKEVKQFTESLSSYLGNAHVIACANGTDALQIAMMALGLKPGDEVILPAHTYPATAEVIALLGLTPVFTDVDADTFNIDVSQIEKKITRRTKAIVPVHLYGQCADMDPILELASGYKLKTVEDAAQSIGATYKKSHSGTIGDIGTTSFFPTKNLGCFGDGGAIITRDAQLAENLLMIANHGQKKKYHHEIVGVNSRLDTMQAAILNVKLKYLDEYQRKRNEAASYYDKALKGVDGIGIPARAENSTHVFHQYTLRATRRDDLKTYLQSKGIPSIIYYPVPAHLQPAYRQASAPEGTFPVAEQLAKEVLSLPMHTELTEEQLDYICSTVISFYRG